MRSLHLEAVQRLHGRFMRDTAALALLLMISACGGGERVIAAPPPTVPVPTDTAGTVQRGSVAVQVTLDAADRDIASALALEPSALADVRVRLAREGAPGTPVRVSVTDVTGRVVFERLLEGRYVLSAERHLTAGERARLAPLDQEVGTLAGGTTVTIGAGAMSVQLNAVASRRGSVTIHELWVYTPSQADRGGWGYPWAQYLSVYNNADTTVFLDGMLLGRSAHVSYNSGPTPPNQDYCSNYASSIRLNTEAPGALWIEQFPGNGKDHPLLPGKGAVIATDAIDHREFAPTTIDLSDADFETIGDATDVDNPFVPNTIRVFGGRTSRGWPFASLSRVVVFLALPPSEPLAATRVLPQFPNIMFVPSNTILDAVGFEVTPEVDALMRSLGFDPRRCDPWMHPMYERDPARFMVSAFYEPRASAA